MKVSENQTTDLPTELGWWARHSPSEELTPLLEAAASEIVRLRTALLEIAGEIPPSDYLLGNSDIARIALHGR